MSVFISAHKECAIYPKLQSKRKATLQMHKCWQRGNVDHFDCIKSEWKTLRLDDVGWIKLIMWFLLARLIKIMHVKCIHTRNKQLKRQLWMQVKPVFTCLVPQTKFSTNLQSRNKTVHKCTASLKQICDQNGQLRNKNKKLLRHLQQQQQLTAKHIS